MRTQYTIFNINTKYHHKNNSKFAAMGFFQGTQERVRNSGRARVISVRAIEVLLNLLTYMDMQRHGESLQD